MIVVVVKEKKSVNFFSRKVFILVYFDRRDLSWKYKAGRRFRVNSIHQFAG